MFLAEIYGSHYDYCHPSHQHHHPCIIFSILMSKLDELPIVWRCGFEFNLNIDGDFYGRGEDLRVSMGYEVEKHMID